MTPLQLAEMVNWAGTLETRKRLQKVIYLLKVYGWNVQADYTLHHFGPYSVEVARVTDQLVQADLLEEQTVLNGVGNQFSYRLTEKAKSQLQQLQSKPDVIQMAAFRDVAIELLGEDLRTLEIASTLAYFVKSGKTWEEAIDSTAQFKKIPSNGATMNSAIELAKKFTR